MLKETVLAFIEDEALSRGAAIAFYTVTSIAPDLLSRAKTWDFLADRYSRHPALGIG